MGVPRWRGLRILTDRDRHLIIIGMRLPDGDWLNLSVPIEPPRPWHSPTFLAAFLLMTWPPAGLTLWAVRRLTAPVRTLAAAAEALGRDVNAPPLPEEGPSEVATAAAAFNTMAARIRRFVQDRTELLTAIGHDLRTPITRLKLRAEFVEDEEQRGRCWPTSRSWRRWCPPPWRSGATRGPPSRWRRWTWRNCAHGAGRGRRCPARRGATARLRGAAASDGAGTAAGAEAGVGQSGGQRGDLWRLRAA